MDYEVFGGVGKEEVNQIASAFIETVEELSGKQVVIYSDLSNARDMFSKELADKYELWLAYYGDYERLYNTNTSWDNWIGVQYSDKGEVAGINGYVDRDLELSRLNNIENPNLIYPGEILTIPNIKVENGNEENATGSIYYTVKRGDTLSEIAAKYGVTVSHIVSQNNIQNPNLIYPGEVLRIKRNSGSDRINNTENNRTYIVKSGDTLYQIARRFGTTVSDIVSKNNIKNPNLIYPGEVINL